VTWRAAAVIAAGIVLGPVAAAAAYPSGELGLALADLAAGWALIGSGLVAWMRRPDSRFGPLTIASGAAWFAGDLAPAALFLHRGPFVHALLSYPAGRLWGRFAAAAVVVAYIDGAVEPVGHDDWATLGLCALVAGAAVHGWLAQRGPLRRARAVPAAGAVAVAMALGLGSAARLAGADVDTAALWAYDAVLIVVAPALALDLLRAGWSAGAVSGLVVDLGGVWEPRTLRDRLARALGDRSLELGYRLGGGYVDEAGRAFTLPGSEAERAVTPIDADGDRIAVLVHDRAVLDDRALVDGVAAAARLAVANARLQAQVRARVEELAASRRRIVEAADDQRQRLERELRDGAARRLDAVRAHVAELGAPDELLAEVERQLDAARRELSELARGIRPAALTSGGLAAALPELGARAPLPVHVAVDAGRLEPAVEAAAYFVCGEALANVVKYAGAAGVRIEVRRAGDRLSVLVADDGAGGADPAGGSGLRGLTDRVEALGGRLDVDSPPGRGTRVSADIPIYGSASGGGWQWPAR
jgi:signal transduction histidine kinase